MTLLSLSRITMLSPSHSLSLKCSLSGLKRSDDCRVGNHAKEEYAFWREEFGGKEGKDSIVNNGPANWAAHPEGQRPKLYLALFFFFNLLLLKE